MISEDSARPSDGTTNGAPSCAARTFVPRDAHERGHKFERCATGTGGQIVVANAMGEFNDEVAIRRENSHRLNELLFFVHFHAHHSEEGGGTSTVPPYKYGTIRGGGIGGERNKLCES